MNRGKGIILMLMLLTFVGQAYASVIMPYSMSMGMPQSTTIQNTMLQSQMSHSNMSEEVILTSTSSKTRVMSLDSVADNNSAQSSLSQTMISDGHEHQDCCKSVCNCAMGSCSSVALTMALPVFDTTTHPLLKMSVFTVSTLNPFPSSLYRPPIFA
ncbi:hypothetical protein FM038_010750 [Shewanella eurypsychrophilus]|uniref:CopL n=1 Tax=Shewanella eurypsychrophilus TaxID=2593656 RepID=A0ABX6V5I2_9GAMM|nr:MULTISPECIES: hypothetical protein [Shewanella]QFU22593.1 hypothetical protein FS418_12330 [Shewanella sp. YLB-09]QPG57882.1 hypothetical protein FM038_010750 [Shewanella eurypsychrophilus]